MKKEKPFFFLEEFTFIIKEYMERVWMFIRDCSLSDLLLDDENILLSVNQENHQNWVPGMTFDGSILNAYNYQGKCVNVETYPNFKKIKWEFSLFEDSVVKIIESLYCIPSSSSTLIFLKIKFSNERERNVFRQIGGEQKLQKLFKKIEDILISISKNVHQFESCIIKATMDDIWNIITKMNKLKLVAPKTKLTCLDETDEEEKVGMIKTITIQSTEPKVKEYKIKVNIIQKNPKAQRWIYGFETVEGNEENLVPNQCVSIHLTRVNKEECQVSVFHDFRSYIPFKFIKGLSAEKIYLLDSVKDYLENFYNSK